MKLGAIYCEALILNQLRVGQRLSQLQFEHRAAEHVGVRTIIALLVAGVRSGRALGIGVGQEEGPELLRPGPPRLLLTD